MMKKSTHLPRIAAIFLLLPVLLMSSACGSRRTYSGSAPAASSAAPAAEAAAPAYEDAYDTNASDVVQVLKSQLSGVEMQNGASSTLTGAPVGRKIITTIDLRMESTDYDSCANSILKAVERAGGYIEYSDIQGGLEAPVSGMSFSGNLYSAIRPMGADYGSYSRRYMELRIRVPQNGLPGFISEVEGYGNVLNKQENAKDVTLEYVDIESRKKALAMEQERLLAMLDKAETVEEIIKLEERMSEVRYQLEKYESQMRVLENQISYSTVNLTLNEVLIYTEKPDDPIPKPTVAQRISIGTKQTFTDIGDYWTNAFVWFMVNLVYILGFIIAMLVIFFVARRALRRVKIKDLPSSIAGGRVKTNKKDEKTEE